MGRKHFDLSGIIWIFFVAILLLLLGLPMYWLVKNSLMVEESLSLLSYRTVFTEPRFRTCIFNSLILASGSSILSLILGTTTAWLISRTDLPFKQLFRGLLSLVLAMPPFLSAIAWILLAAPNSGWINKLYRNWTGAEDKIVNIYSMWGAIFVIGLSTYPYVFLLT